VLHGHGDLVLALERDLAGQHLPQHDPQGVEVGLPGAGVPERLLGRDVVGGAEHAAVRGQALLVQGAGDPEVRDLRASLGVDEDVLRLHVAMDDVALVRRAERTRDLDGVGDGLADGQAPASLDALLERLALDVLEDDVRAAVVLARVDHGDDVRVRELRHGARLAPEALDLVGVGRDLAMQELDRHRPLEGHVERAVDRRHPARAHLGVEAVAAVQLCADQGAHGIVPILRPRAKFMRGRGLIGGARRRGHGAAGTSVARGVRRNRRFPLGPGSERLSPTGRGGRPGRPRR
jgi:hypothetical protein